MNSTKAIGPAACLSLLFARGNALRYVTDNLMNRLFWLLLFNLPFFSNSAEIPASVIPSGVGVNIHFVSGHEKELDLIAAAGFRSIRMDFGWSAIETAKGKYNWSEYEELLSNLDRRGLRAVFILDYSNPLYEPEVTSTNPLTHQSHRTTASPQHPESIAAFADWAAAAAKHFQGRHVLWELWNEPNIDFWSPEPDVHQYSALALAAAKAVRQADAGATIVGPASSGFPREFLETFFQSGILEYLDAVSVHPYREPKRSPETATADYQKLRALIDRYAPGNKKPAIPILSGEWGYSSWERGVSIETQAQFAVRQQLVNLLNNVPLSIWYDWKNDGDDPKENEHNFGTVKPDLTPKPAYQAISVFTRELTGYRITRRLLAQNENDYLIVLSASDGNKKLAAWTTRESHTVTIKLSGNVHDLNGLTSNGERFTPTLDANQCTLELNTAPKFLSLGSANPE
jgi:hypothetical protein